MAALAGISGAAAWLDGCVIDQAALAIPAGDAGFVLGATVTEQLRTFRGRLFLPEPHAQRLLRSLELVGLSAAWSITEIMTAAAAVAAHNHRLLPVAADGSPGDLALVIFVTAGDLPAQHGGRAGRPRVGIHTVPLAFGMWAAAYGHGLSLRSVSVTQVPDTCWPLAAKVRSRLHYHLADREAAALEAGARAVLAHEDGRISETTTANVAIVHGGKVATPPAGDALAGVSLGFARDLAGRLGIVWEERSLRAGDLAAAEEILLTSTPNCILPVTRFDGIAVGDGRPGPVFTHLLDAWSSSVGLDVAGQARRHAGHGNHGT